MNDLDLRLLAIDEGLRQSQPHRPLGRILVERGMISQEQLVKALHLQVSQAAPLGDILVSEGWVRRDEVEGALAEQSGLRQVDMSWQSPHPALAKLRPVRFWLHHGVIPWRRRGDRLMIATARPDRFDQVREALSDIPGEIEPVLASEADIRRTIQSLFRRQLAQAASTRVAEEVSCRTWKPITQHTLAFMGALPLLLLIAMPLASLGVIALIAVVTMLMFSFLKLSGMLGHILDNAFLTAHGAQQVDTRPARLPCVSMLVPLYKEKEIAGALVKRLKRLTYPKGLLDVVLVLEEHDEVTKATLAATQLPSWMRVIEVPEHEGLTTKPRAMNYALDFCKGEIIGIWDAEDAPVPNQIEHVVSKFATVDDDVVCLQGILDFYNPRTNWRARCFTIEYSSWFRVVLPGIARLGLVVPLGGTTLFFKRNVLEELGGWDSHNVTEDADLGVRLCRAGYRTEMINTVTYEEANYRAWPWVKQRSRWLKGFMVTYLVHMRHPARLLADLGPWRFFGFQAFFLGTLGQFLLAPLLWTMWVMLFGIWHPIQEALPQSALYALIGVCAGVELMAIVIGSLAVSAAQRRYLIPWVPTMMFYMPFGVLAAYKALYELIFIPFYWDKTEHGKAVEESDPT
jgi:cellulose synthase/poly-beta-1,6-N-acetylglucosamine synthase-like glycosyltransferase